MQTQDQTRRTLLIALVVVMLGGIGLKVRSMNDPPAVSFEEGSAAAGTSQSSPLPDAPGGPAGDNSPSGQRPGTTSLPPATIVDVVGAVKHPGVYRFTSDQSDRRINDAVQAAGGPTANADLERINLAAHLVDGQQIVVPRRGQTSEERPSPLAAPVQDRSGSRSLEPVGSPSGLSPPEVSTSEPSRGRSGKATTLTHPIALNTATLEELMQLPGIGPKTGQKILDYRQEKGGFKSPDDLLEIPGFGQRKLERIRDLIVAP